MSLRPTLPSRARVSRRLTAWYVPWIDERGQQAGKEPFMRSGLFIAVVAGVAMSVAACSNREGTAGNTAGKASDANPTIKLTGCLTQGSSSNTFTLENARFSDAKDRDAYPNVPASTSYV